MFTDLTLLVQTVTTDSYMTLVSGKKCAEMTVYFEFLLRAVLSIFLLLLLGWNGEGLVGRNVERSEHVQNVATFSFQLRGF